METNDKKYIVYMHTSPNMKRYIGITSLDPVKRWRNGRGYKDQSYFWNAIKKYGWDNFKHEVLIQGVSFEEACALEQKFIQDYKTYDSKYGYNLTLGGEGRVLTDEQKKKLSEQRQGPNACGYGYFPSEETKKKMSDAAKGKIFTKKTREKMANAKKKVVYQYNLDGEFLNIFESATDGANATGTNIGNLCACCRNVVKQANGFFWSYSFIEDPSLIRQYLDGEVDFSIIKTRNEKQVIQMDLNDNELCVFNSICDASLATGIPAQEISQACKNTNKVTREFKWKFSEDNHNNNFEVINQKSNPCLHGKQKPLIYYRSDRNRWTAYIVLDGKRKTIKACKTKEEAIDAYFEYIGNNKEEN